MQNCKSRIGNKPVATAIAFIQIFSAIRTKSLAVNFTKIPYWLRGNQYITHELGYIDKRIESLEAAVKTSDALLENDRAAAIAANDSYNAADRAAAELARNLPASISDQVKAQYADELAQKEGAYATARSTAIAADAALRARGAAF